METLWDAIPLVHLESGSMAADHGLDTSQLTSTGVDDPVYRRGREMWVAVPKPIRMTGHRAARSSARFVIPARSSWTAWTCHAGAVLPLGMPRRLASSCAWLRDRGQHRAHERGTAM